MKLNKRIIGTALALSFATSASPVALMAMDAADDAEAIISQIEARAEGNIDITFESASKSGGDIVVQGLKVVSDKKDGTATAQTAIFGDPGSDGTPSSVELQGFEVKGDKDQTVNIENLKIVGASAINFVMTETDIDEPYELFNAMTGENRIEISGLDVNADDGDQVSMEKLSIVVDATKKVLESFTLSNLSVDEAGDRDKVNVGNINVGGIRYGTFMAMMEQEDKGRDDEEAMNAAIDAFVEDLPDALGLHTFNMNDIVVHGRKGKEVTVDEIAIDNLKYHNGALVGADLRISNTGVQSAPEAQELGMEGFVVDVNASTGVSEDGKSIVGNANVTLRDGAVLEFSQKSSIDSIDSYVNESLELAKEQIRMVLRDEFKTGDKGADQYNLKSLFLHENINLEVKLTDLGAIAAAISKQAEQSGQSVDMLAMQAPMILPMVLNGQLPEDQIVGLSGEVTEFLKGSPFHVVFDTVDGWRDVVKGVIESGDTKGLSAQKIVTVSFPAD